MQVIAYEPEPLEREYLNALLTHEGYAPQLLLAEESVLTRVRKHPGAMVMVSMAELERGLRLCERIRTETTSPMVALLNRADEELETRLYELGVDEVITRPIRPRQFVARLESLRRRSVAPVANAEEGMDKLVIGQLQLIPSRLELRKEGEVIHLTPLQTRILYHLMANAGQIVPRTRLEDKVWGYDGEVLSNAIKTHICHLRQKLEDDPLAPRFIQTVKGVGYLFQKPIPA
jgi:two-component system alkaline phosphatase synthesis response regulator PhoP